MAGTDQGLIGIWDLRSTNRMLRELSLAKLLDDYRLSNDSDRHVPTVVAPETVSSGTPAAATMFWSRDLRETRRTDAAHAEMKTPPYSTAGLVRTVVDCPVEIPNIASLSLHPRQGSLLAFQLRNSLACGLIDLASRRVLQLFQPSHCEGKRGRR